MWFWLSLHRRRSVKRAERERGPRLHELSYARCLRLQPLALLRGQRAERLHPDLDALAAHAPLPHARDHAVNQQQWAAGSALVAPVLVREQTLARGLWHDALAPEP